MDHINVHIGESFSKSEKLKRNKTGLKTEIIKYLLPFSLLRHNYTYIYVCVCQVNIKSCISIMLRPVPSLSPCRYSRICDTKTWISSSFCSLAEGNSIPGEDKYFTELYGLQFLSLAAGNATTVYTHADTWEQPCWTKHCG